MKLVPIDEEEQKPLRLVPVANSRRVQDIPESEFTPPNIALETAKGTLGVLGKSAGNLAAGVTYPIRHPIKTVQGLSSAATHPKETAQAVKGYLGKRYGSIDNIADTVATDPLGFVADVYGAGSLAGGFRPRNLPMTTQAIKKGAGAVDALRGKAEAGLRSSAEKSYTKALGPTTKGEREIASKVVPGLVEKKNVFATRGGLLEKAADETEKAGERLEVGYLTLPKKSRIDAGAVVKSIQNKQEDLKVNGILPDVNKQHFDQLERVKNDFTNLAKDSKVSPQTLREIRQVYDKAIETSKKGFTMTGRGGARLDAQRVLANSIRREIAKKYPSISALNKEFSFWSNLSDLLETTTPKSKGLLSGIHAFAAEHAGAASPYVGLFANLSKIFSDNVLWNSLAGSSKSRIADLISKGNINGANLLVSRYLSGAKKGAENAVKSVRRGIEDLGERGSTGATPRDFDSEFQRNKEFYEANKRSPKSPSDVKNWIVDTLTNDQVSTSKELSEYFMKEGGFDKNTADFIASKQGKVNDIVEKQIEQRISKGVEDKLKTSLNQVGAKFKSLTNQENSLYQDEPTLYFDVMSPEGKPYTFTIRPSQATPENIINKVKSMNPKAANLLKNSQDKTLSKTINIFSDKNGMSAKLANKIVNDYETIGQGTKRGVTPLFRRTSGQKSWEDMTRDEKVYEIKERIKQDFDVAKEEIKNHEEGSLDYLINRALDPLDPMKEVYSEILRRLGFLTKSGKFVKMPQNMKTIKKPEDLLDK